MIKILCFLLVISLFPFNVYANESSVYDNASLFTESTIQSLTDNNNKIKELVDIEIVVMTVETIGNNTIEEYAEEMFAVYDIGNIRENNGMLILICEMEKQSVVLYGVGVEDVIASDKILEYQDLYLTNNKHNDGIIAFYNAIEEDIDLYVEQLSKEKKVIGIENFYVPIIIASLLFVIYISTLIVNKKKLSKKIKSYKY